jgi:hypothetical protein
VQEVAAIHFDTSTNLHEGSANDGTGTATQKGFVFGKSYKIVVVSYATQAPVDPAQVKWQVKYTSPASSSGGETVKLLAARGDQLTFVCDDKHMCGCDVTITAFIQQPSKGALLTVFHHNRYRWFDSKRVEKQISQRQSAPWRN